MRWLRDPLVLFIVLGAMLAALHRVLRDERPALARETEIVVTEADIVRLGQVFKKTWHRPPTEEELRALVDRRVRDEILYREAVVLGLGQGDEALRRRLVLKLEFLAKDAGAVAPTDAELRAFLDADPARYARSSYRTFAHVYFSTDRRGAKAEDDAQSVLERFRSEPNLAPATLGDRIMLDVEQVHLAPHDVQATFGAEFAEGVFKQEVGTWGGPLRSGYGLHLVLVREETPGTVPPFEDVRERIRRDLIEHRSTASLAAYLEALREKYDVSIRVDLGTDGGR